jgi:hypothetical protein
MKGSDESEEVAAKADGAIKKTHSNMIPAVIFALITGLDKEVKPHRWLWKDNC